MDEKWMWTHMVYVWWSENNLLEFFLCTFQSLNWQTFSKFFFLPSTERLCTVVLTKFPITLLWMHVHVCSPSTSHSLMVLRHHFCPRDVFYVATKTTNLFNQIACSLRCVLPRIAIFNVQNISFFMWFSYKLLRFCLVFSEFTVLDTDGGWNTESKPTEYVVWDLFMILDGIFLF